MERKRFGRTELMVSRLCFGCVSFGVKDPARDWDPFTTAGETASIELLEAAVEAGITMFDTSPDYGDGHSERLLGRALHNVRHEVVIATKVDYGGKNADEVRASVAASLARLGTDYIDIIQFHGGNYPPGAVKRIVDKGLLDTLLDLKREGWVHHLGFTVADPITARDLIETGEFDTAQLLYNFVEQSAARHALRWTAEHDLGVTVMRPLAGGMLDRLLAAIAPEWPKHHTPAEVCLKFLLSDPRVHTINVGMRSLQELRQNSRFVHDYVPAIDIAELPRSVGQLARANANSPE